MLKTASSVYFGSGVKVAGVETSSSRTGALHGDSAKSGGICPHLENRIDRVRLGSHPSTSVNYSVAPEGCVSNVAYCTPFSHNCKRFAHPFACLSLFQTRHDYGEAKFVVLQI